VYKYLSIGEFSKLCGISRKTLIYYDKEQIFSPELRKENGYRYYSYFQLDAIGIIQDLRSIGMSLKDIKIYFSERTPKICIEMLENQQKILQEKISELQNTNKAINQKISVTQKGIDLKNIGEIYFKEEQDMNVIEMKRKDIYNENVMEDIVEFIKYTQEMGMYMGYPIGVAVELKQILNHEYGKIGRIYMRVDEKIQDKYFKVRPKGLYACIMHKGRYDETYRSYEKLIKTIQSKNYKIVGPSYENTIIDFFSVQDEEMCLTELTIPVE